MLHSLYPPKYTRHLLVKRLSVLPETSACKEIVKIKISEGDFNMNIAVLFGVTSCSYVVSEGLTVTHTALNVRVI
jgi:hypothetical protein